MKQQLIEMLKNCPSIFKAKDIKKWTTESKKISYNGLYESWVPARPINPYLNIWKRLKISYLVFIGRYDALDWD